MKKFILGITIGVLTCYSVCFADVQSRPDRVRLTSQTVNQFFLKIRNMEASGGVLGKTATINQTNGIETTASNGIDSHMVKNTEYGAAAILAVSQYGYRERVPEIVGTYTASGNVVSLGDSTTGAAGTESYYYGLFDMANRDRFTYTASIHTSGASAENRSIFYDACHGNSSLSRYVDLYPNPASGIDYYRGDATLETSRWRGATDAGFVNANYPVSPRSGGMFGYGRSTGPESSAYGSRAVVVCGSGI